MEITFPATPDRRQVAAALRVIAHSRMRTVRVLGVVLIALAGPLWLVDAITRTATIDSLTRWAAVTDVVEQPTQLVPRIGKASMICVPVEGLDDATLHRLQQLVRSRGAVPAGQV